MRPRSELITADRLRQLLTYDPDTGVFRWRVRRGNRMAVGEVAGYCDNQGYIVISIDGKAYGAARLAFFYMQGEWPPHQIDHRDLDKLNNRWDNLRPATNAQNQCNTLGHGSSSGLKNIYLNPNKPSCYKVCVAGFRSRSFRSIELAIEYRDALLKDRYGEFARV